MKLKELVDQVWARNLDSKSIGIYNGPGKTIYPDFADEILETHGELEVGAWKLHNPFLLLVQIKED